MIWRIEWQSWIVPVGLLSLSLIYALFQDLAGKSCPSVFHGANLAAAVTGVALTIVSTWSWWRILRTYRGFLLNAAGTRPK